MKDGLKLNCVFFFAFLSDPAQKEAKKNMST